MKEDSEKTLQSPDKIADHLRVTYVPAYLLAAAIGNAYSEKSGLMMIRPQCSQMMSFLLEAISTRRCGVIVLKHPPQESPLTKAEQD